MNVSLVAPSKEHEAAYHDFVEDWKHNNEDITPFSARLLDRDYDQWLEDTNKYEIEAPNGFVTAHTYFLINSDKQILGAINIRHSLNDYLLQYGGHIGYGIRPTFRKQGFAKEMLSLALIIATELGIKRALITCDKTNIGSAKTIMRNGGILENEVVDTDHELIQRYWIDLERE